MVLVHYDLRASIMAGAELAESDVRALERRKPANVGALERRKPTARKTPAQAGEERRKPTARKTPAQAGKDTLRGLLLAQQQATH